MTQILEQETTQMTLTVQSDQENEQPQQRTIALDTESDGITWSDEYSFSSRETWTVWWSGSGFVSGGFVSSKPDDPSYSKRGRVCGNGFAQGDSSTWYTTVKNQSEENKLKGYFWVKTG